MERYEVEDLLGEFEFLEYTNERGTIPYRRHIPEGGAKGAPLVLFMHGAGERGTDNCLPLRAAIDTFVKCNPETKEAVFIVPQCPRQTGKNGEEEGFWVLSPWGLGNFDSSRVEESWELANVFEILKKNIKELEVDTDRIYVMGLSMGGFATWDLISRHGEYFAAAMPICGGADPALAEKIKDIPIRTFHGAEDDIVPPSGTREMAEALRAAGAADFDYVEFPGVNHWSWDPACAYPGIGKWMFSQRLSNRIKK